MFDGLAWLMQIVLFVTLGLLLTPSKILPVIGTGMLISGFLIVAARPLSVLLCLIPFKMEFRRRLYISWVGLRGAVPIVFATYPLIAGIEKAEMIFSIVFFISVTSVLIQGTSLSKVAKWLNMSLPAAEKVLDPIDIFLSEDAKTALEEITLTSNNPAVNKMIVELDFPKTAIIAMIKRGEKFITPSGSTVLKEGDQLMILSDTHEGVQQVRECLGRA